MSRQRQHRQHRAEVERRSLLIECITTQHDIPMEDHQMEEEVMTMVEEEILHDHPGHQDLHEGLHKVQDHQGHPDLLGHLDHLEEVEEQVQLEMYLGELGWILGCWRSLGSSTALLRDGACGRESSSRGSSAVNQEPKRR